MGEGTSRFERRFARELATLRQAGQIAGMSEGTYVNDPLGIGFTLPSGWILRDRREVAETAEGRLLSSHEDDWNEAFRSLSDAYLPLVTISAPPWDDPVARLGPHELSPVVVIQLEQVIADDEGPAFDLWDHVATDLGYFHAHIEDFRLITSPRRATLSDCEAVSYAAAYTLLHADAAQGCPTREHALYVRQGSAVYALRACDYPERSDRLSFDFSPFLASVCFR